MIYLLVAYLFLNLLAFTIFVVDKVKAQMDKWRISEKTLLVFAALGPFGAALAMSRFRHKTKKLKFKLVYVALLTHIILLIVLVYYFL